MGVGKPWPSKSREIKVVNNSFWPVCKSIPTLPTYFCSFLASDHLTFSRKTKFESQRLTHCFAVYELIEKVGKPWPSKSREIKVVNRKISRKTNSEISRFVNQSDSFD